MRKKRALVTGASGFVGGHLTEYVHKKGYEIWASYHTHQKKFPFAVRWVRADLTRFDETLALLEKSRPHLLFHLAALTPASWKHPSQTFSLNTGGSIALLEAALRFAPRARIVFISTSHVYGETFFSKRRVRENDLANPLTPYAASKLLMELTALNFVKCHPLQIVVARGFNQVGTGQEKDFVFSDYCRQIALMEKRRRPAVLEVGNSELVRDFIHIEDAVRAYFFLAQKGRPGEIYNVGSGRGMSLKEGVDFLARESRVPFTVRSVASRFRRSDYPHGVSDCSKMQALGWRPERSVREALQELLDEWRAKVCGK